MAAPVKQVKLATKGAPLKKAFKLPAQASPKAVAATSKPKRPKGRGPLA